ncbi:MAG: CoA ester lyase [Actinobacteria bacterium]|nr:CoA ester lyase [Actinomycetota bacterium]
MLRSFLYAPGSSERILSKVLGAGADAVVLDLEDAVAPQDKPAAREAVAALVAQQATGAPCEVHVRVNRAGRGWNRDDVAAVVAPGLAALRLPKAESGSGVAAVARLLDDHERACGMPVGTVGLYPTIESARGVEQARALAAAPRVVALAFGAADFLADIGARGGDGRDATLLARSTLVLASRAAGIRAPADGAFTDLDDLEGLRDAASWARSLGFVGKSAIHPRQVEIIHAVFAPSPEERSWAEQVVAAAGGGAATAVVDGEFVDAPVLQRARAVLALDREGGGDG